MNNDLPRALIVVAVILALGMSAAAFIFGEKAQRIGSGRQSIAVKGLAEKSLKADYAEWRVATQAKGATFADALKILRTAVPATRKFLLAQGFAESSLQADGEKVMPNMVEDETREGRFRMVQKGFVATQNILITSTDLGKIAAANKAIVQFQADGNPVTPQEPLYLVSHLEEVKMSLIGAATQNAQKRAEEFAKNGNTKVGAMRYASQGAFYILAAGANSEMDDYSGAYDKTTVDKTARVVVTIEYNIEQ